MTGTDKTTQQIQNKLGPFDVMQRLLYADDQRRLIGIAGAPPASPSPCAPRSSSSASSSATTSSQPEFKKPPSQRHPQPPQQQPPPQHRQQQQQRSGFVKPADGKPPYAGRGGFPGRSVKHGEQQRSNGALAPPKGPPPPSQPIRASNRPPHLPRLNCDPQVSDSHDYQRWISIKSV